MEDPLSQLGTVMVLLISLVVQPCVVRAAGPSDPAKVQARALRAEAESYQAAGKPREALERYQAAYKLVPTPLLLWPMAQLHRELGQHQEGLNALTRYEEGVPPEHRPPGQQAEEVAALRAQLELIARPPPQQQPKPVAPPTPVAIPAPVAKPPLRRPLYKKWWFWGAVGIVVAGTVAGVTAGVLSSRDPLRGVPPDARRTLAFSF